MQDFNLLVILISSKWLKGYETCFPDKHDWKDITELDSGLILATINLACDIDNANVAQWISKVQHEVSRSASSVAQGQTWKVKRPRLMLRRRASIHLFSMIIDFSRWLPDMSCANLVSHFKFIWLNSMLAGLSRFRITDKHYLRCIAVMISHQRHVDDLISRWSHWSLKLTWDRIEDSLFSVTLISR